MELIVFKALEIAFGTVLLALALAIFLAGIGMIMMIVLFLFGVISSEDLETK